MTMTRSAAPSSPLAALVLAVLLPVAPTAAQQDACFRGVDVPLSPWIWWNAEAPDGPGPETEVELDPGAQSPLDARWFTPSPNDHLRDLDGDGDLDAVHLFDGVTVWLGDGTGRFGTPSFQQNLAQNTSPIVGQFADLDDSGTLDALFISDFAEVYLDDGAGGFVRTPPAPVPLPVEFNFNSWTVADMDGDGLHDVVGRAGHGFPGTSVQIMWGQGGAQFGPNQVIDFPPGFADEFGLGDLDNDGLMDIVCHFDLSGHFLRTYIQTRDRLFFIGGGVAVPAYQALLEVRDMTGDGLADVVAHSLDVRIYEGAGDGSFTGDGILLPGVEAMARFVDVDADGLVDILTPGESDFFIATAGQPAVILSKADGSQEPPRVVPHAAHPHGTGDLDGDGILDVFTRQVVLLGRGDGSFLVPRNFHIGRAVNGQSELALGDIDEDGRVDVATITNGGPFAGVSGATITLRESPTSWRAPSSITTSNVTGAIALEDVNGDDNLDMVISHQNGSFTDILLGRGDGTFDPAVTVSMGGIFGNWGVGVGHLNTDGVPELLSAGDGFLNAKKGLGGLTFGALKSWALPAGSADEWLLTHDVDGDGLTDVFVMTPEVQFFRCIGHTDFDPPVQVAGATSHLRVVDVDADGFEDLLTGDGTSVRVALGDGTGSFSSAPHWNLNAGFDAQAMDVGDVDGDGILDLGVGHAGAWSLHLGLPAGGFDPTPEDVFDLPGGAHLLRLQDLDLDGRPDLLAYGTGASDLGITAALNLDGPWTDHGLGLPGDGVTPHLLPTGTLQGNSPVGLELDAALPSTVAHLVYGFAGLFAPLKGGTLVPDPFDVITPFVTSPAGTLAVSTTWPAGVPAGSELWMQVWVNDPSGPKGVTASNGVSGASP
jgi:hypothetical protein